MDKLNDLFTKIINKLNKKVDSVEGKQLSSEDFTSEEKTKLQGIADEAQVNTVESISVNGTKVDSDEKKNVDIKAYNEYNKPEVGGTNLLIGTKDFSGENWDTSSANKIDKTDDGFSVFYKPNAWNGLSYIFDKQYEPGLYTFSAWVKADFESSGKYEFIINTDDYANYVRISYDETAKWKRISTQLLFDGTERNLSISGTPQFNKKGSIYVYGLKLERGEIATDWSPAPEDLETEIDEKIDDIQIGGRNLYTGTKDWEGDFGSFISLWSKETEKYLGLSVLSHASSYDNLSQTVSLPKGNYILSLYAKSKSNNNYTTWYIAKSAKISTIKSSGVIEYAGDIANIYGVLILKTDWQRGYLFFTLDEQCDFTFSFGGTTQQSEDSRVYICGLKLERGNKPTDWSPAPEDLAPIDEQKILAQIANRTYQGTDLTVKFKSEIDGSFNGNPWAWIQSRINNANWNGIHICDYIPFTTTNSVTMQAQIAGIDTYYQYSDVPVPHHIDFITREIWPTLHTFNLVNYNNGTAEQNYPWLASDMYLWLNSKAGTVPNATTVNPKTTEVDYTANGVYYFLPEELKAVIIEKQFLLETRYNASSLLTTSPGWGWQNEGKLWLPTEMEVYGTNVWGGAGYPTGGGIQYPIFANSMNRLKYRSGSRGAWWLSTPDSGNSTNWCDVNGSGYANGNTATDPWIGAPVCFRIALTVKSADMPVEGPEMMDEYMQYDEAVNPEFERPVDTTPETED